MNALHDYAGVIIVLIAVGIGMIFNRQDYRDLGGRLDRMQADLSQFYKTLGSVETKIENLEKGAK